jgi:F-type H+-transporting ATPase subunit c
MIARISKIALGLCAGLVTMMVATAAYAEELGGAAALADRNKWVAIAAGLGIAIAAVGGAIGQSRAASAALEGIARNPSAASKLFTPMILGLALIESLVIYSLIISILLIGKIQ